jgi:ABC-type sugar transport system ATPase subunit
MPVGERRLEQYTLHRSTPGADRPPGPIFRVVRLTKDFPGVRALDDVSLTIAPGEIMALLGANGAGKSTLIQILAGAHIAGSYAGDLELARRPYRPTSTSEGERAGVALVPQEVNVVPDLSVAENICLNREPRRFGMVDMPGRQAAAQAALQDFGLEIDPAAPMASLDLATQQLVIIARALSQDARVLILDEPTAALTEGESHRLFERMRALRAKGVAVIFVSHRLAEVFAVSDRIVVMRDGRICGDHRTSEVSRETVVAEMVGEISAGVTRPSARRSGAAALAVKGMCVFDPTTENRPRVDHLDLTIQEGEIVGLFGLLGSGSIEAALAIYGAWLGPWNGQIAIGGEPVSIDNPADAVRLGLGLMAQDRRDCLMPEQSVADNIGIASLDKIVSVGVLDVWASRRRAEDQVAALQIKTPSIDADVQTLSGGNQQKVQVARWLAADARIFLLIDPTRGVDVGARNEIKRIWFDLSRDGRAILIASTDSEELVDVCDRVVVMRQGRKVGELAGLNLTEPNLLRMAADG